MALKKPNIVVYLSDDHGWEYLGCYGNPHIQTPHLDSIAYFTQHHPVEELYDVTVDPYEFNNLAFDANMRPVLERMRSDVRNWMHTQNDEGQRETWNPN